MNLIKEYLKENLYDLITMILFFSSIIVGITGIVEKETALIMALYSLFIMTFSSIFSTLKSMSYKNMTKKMKCIYIATVLICISFIIMWIYVLYILTIVILIE